MEDKLERILTDLVLSIGRQVTEDYELKHGVYEGMSVDNVKSRDVAMEAIKQVLTQEAAEDPMTDQEYEALVDRIGW